VVVVEVVVVVMVVCCGSSLGCSCSGCFGCDGGLGSSVINQLCWFWLLLWWLVVMVVI